MKIVGHLILHHNDTGVFSVEGEPGAAYNYIMAGNGLFIQAENSHLRARLPVADARVRGLPLAQPFVTLKHGRLPQRFWDLALSVFYASPETERYVGITWNGCYQLYVPQQTGSGAALEYEVGHDVVVELHSHPGFGPGPSDIDDRDEQGLKIYGIVGELDEARPSVYLRAGVYGYFQPVTWGEVFEGNIGDVIDTVAIEREDAHA